MSENPDLRPACVKDIIPLIGRYRKKRRYVLMGIRVAVVVLTAGLAFVLSYSRHTGGVSDDVHSKVGTTVPISGSDSVSGNAEDLYVADDHVDSTRQPARILDNCGAEAAGKANEQSLAEQENRNESVEALPVGIERDVRKYARAAAARQFEKHIQLLDTTTDASVFKLCYVGHWRWLAKQEVSRWIDRLKVSDERKQLMKKSGENTVVEYEKEHLKEHRDAVAKCRNRSKSMFSHIQT